MKEELGKAEMSVSGMCCLLMLGQKRVLGFISSTRGSHFTEAEQKQQPGNDASYCNLAKVSTAKKTK